MERVPMPSLLWEVTAAGRRASGGGWWELQAGRNLILKKEGGLAGRRLVRPPALQAPPYGDLLGSSSLPPSPMPEKEGRRYPVLGLEEARQ